MIRLYLRRYGSTPMGTFGTLTLEEEAPSGRPEVLYECFTVELPWKGNVPYESCIPEGHYRVAPRYYNTGEYDAYEICNVEGRTHILFHIANSKQDLLGCCGLGMGHGFVHGEWAVTSSRMGFGNFMSFMRGREASLYITWTHHPEAL